jgi:hypothetical protein
MTGTNSLSLLLLCGYGGAAYAHLAVAQGRAQSKGGRLW